MISLPFSESRPIAFEARFIFARFLSWFCLNRLCLFWALPKKNSWECSKLAGFCFEQISFWPERTFTVEFFGVCSRTNPS